MRREVLPPRRLTSPLGAILLSTSTMLLAIAASTLLLRERAFPAGSTTLRAPSGPLIMRPATPCHARRSSFPLQPPTAEGPALRAAVVTESR